VKNEVDCVAVADGGDGLVDVLAQVLNGQVISTKVSGPLSDPVEATYCLINNGKTAVVEMAKASGLVLLEDERRNPEKTTTLGTGELIRNSLDRGVKRVVIGLGGSATCDGGIGAATALGYKFLDRNGSVLDPIGANLIKINTIDLQNVDKRIFDVVVDGVCDVANTLTGKGGASYVYSPQKGADHQQVIDLDRGLCNLAEIIRKDLGVDVENLRGAGAAGGLGAGVHAFMGGRLRKGIDLVVDLVGLKEKLADTDLVITGEGRIDNQTFFDKAPAGVAKAALNAGVPCIAIAGSIGDNINNLHSIGIDAVFTLCRGPVTLEHAVAHGKELLENAAEQVIRLFISANR